MSDLPGISINETPCPYCGNNDPIVQPYTLCPVYVALHTLLAYEWEWMTNP